MTAQTPLVLNAASARITRLQSGDTLSAASLPLPGSSSIGGVQSYSAVTHQFLTSITTSGVPVSAQPAANWLSDGTTGTGGAVVLATGATVTGLIVGTPAASDNSTLAASTAYVTSAINTVLAMGPNKAYCDLACAPSTALPSNTYSNGSSGVGATITIIATGVLTVDGTSATLGMSLLVWNEVTGSHNGIYTVTVAGAIGVAAVLTRRSDFNSPSEIGAGDVTFIVGGSTMSGRTMQLITPNPITVGTTSLTFTQIAGAGSYVNGTGLTLTGSTFSVNASQTQITAVGTLTTLTVSGATTLTGTNPQLVLGVTSSVAGGIKFFNASNGHVLTLQTGVTTADTTFTLPVADGAVGNVWMTNGSGVLSLANSITITTTTFASTVTPVGSYAFNVFRSGTQTGNITYANPSGTAVDGNELVIFVVMDGTGHTISFGTAYAFGTDITTSLIPITASVKFMMKFIYDGSDSKWRAVAIARGF